MKIRRLMLIVLALVLVSEVAGARPHRRARAERPAVLVMYDSAGPYGGVGEVYAVMLRNLLGHFNASVTTIPVSQYDAVRSGSYSASFYLGSTYDEPSFYAAGSPERISWNDFVSDVATHKRPVAWFGFNLWKMAWSWDTRWGSSFKDTFGFDFMRLDQSSQYNRVSYKNTDLDKGVVRHASPGAAISACTQEPQTGFYDCSPELGLVSITNRSLASEYASAWSTVTGARDPYVVRANGLWYVGDIPFSYASEDDRYLVIADALHDMLGVQAAEKHTAMVRLEDVNANTPADAFGAVQSVLADEGVPYTVAAIPFYRDPSGVNSGGSPVYMSLSSSATGNAIADAVRSGQAHVLQHGTTHQSDLFPNPYNRVTADDFEFYRVVENADHALQFVGPMPDDSASWATGRIAQGEKELRKLGGRPFAWEAPHYTASAVDYRAIAAMYPIQYARVYYFTSAGRGFGQFYPYPVVDSYGEKIIPEDLGDISPTSWQGYAATTPEDLIRHAKNELVVRDGYASFFFHPYLDSSLLRQTIDGIKQLGYTFIAGCSIYAVC